MLIELCEVLGGLSERSARPRWGLDMARAVMEPAGVEIIEMREEFPRTEFFDIGAVVYYLRLVVWIVPGFSVERYRSELIRIHQHIEKKGSFVAHAHRFLIDARPHGPR